MKTLLKNVGRKLAMIMAFAMVVTGMPNVGLLNAIQAQAASEQIKTITFWSGANTDDGKKSVTNAFPDSSLETPGDYAVRGEGKGYAWIEVLSKSSNTKIKDNYSIQLSNTKSQLKIVVPAGAKEVSISAKASSGSTSKQGKAKITYKANADATDEVLCAETEVSKTGIGTTTALTAKKTTDDASAGGIYTIIPTQENVCLVELVLTYKYDAYTVSFDSQEGSTVSSENVAKGAKATRPATDPTKAHYRFDDWYTSADGNTKFDFANTVISDDTVIYAHWIPLYVLRPNYTLDEGSKANGSIEFKDANGDPITETAKNEVVTVVGTPEENYVLNKITVTGDGIEALEVSAARNVATFTMPAADVTVTADFMSEAEWLLAAPKWTIAATSDDIVETKISTSAETIDGNDLSDVLVGTEVFATANILDDKYYVTGITYKKEAEAAEAASNAVAVEGKEGVYKFVAPAKEAADDAKMNITVSAETEKKPEVKFAEGLTATITSGSGLAYGIPGTDIKFTVEAPAGKILTKVTKDGEEITASEGVYTVKLGTKNVEIAAEYVDKHFVINMNDVYNTTLSAVEPTNNKKIIPNKTETAIANGVSLHTNGTSNSDSSISKTNRYVDYPCSYFSNGSVQWSSGIYNKSRSIKLDLIAKANIRVIADADDDGETGKERSFGTRKGDSSVTKLDNTFRVLNKCLAAYDFTIEEAGVYYISNLSTKSANIYAIEVEYEPETSITDADRVAVKYDYNLEPEKVITNPTAVKDMTLVNPGTPTLEGYIFEGWYNGDEEWIFDEMVVPAEGVTLTAKWREATMKLTVADGTEATVTIPESGSNITYNPETDESTAVAGKKVKVIITPTAANIEAHKAVKSVTVSYEVPNEETGISEPKTVGDVKLVADDTYEFTMPAYDVTISADVEQQYAATVVPNENATEITVDEEAENYYFAGDEVSISATPANGYYVSKIKVNGEDAATFEDPTTGPENGGEATYPYVMTADGATVSVEVEKIAYAITTEANYTTITVEGGLASATIGDVITFSVTPDTDCVLSSVLVNDEVWEPNADGTYSFTMDTCDVKITANAGASQELTWSWNEAQGDVEFETNLEENAIVGGAQVTVIVKPVIGSEAGYRVVRDEEGKPFITVSANEAEAGNKVYASEGDANKFEFTMPNSDAKVTVEFEEIPVRTVRFENGDELVKEVYVYDEYAINTDDIPADPTADGYIFVEWQLDDEEFNFESAITGDIILKAAWERDLSTFTNVEIKAWPAGTELGDEDNISIKTRTNYAIDPEDEADVTSRDSGKGGLVFTAYADGLVHIEFKHYGDKNKDLKLEDKTEGDVSGAAENKGTVVMASTAGNNTVHTYEFEVKQGHKYLLSLGSAGNFGVTTLAYKITGTPIVRHTVTFNTNGGSEIAAVKVEDGKTTTAPTAPTKEGYTFAGWYSDADCTTAFDFTNAITANTTVYAKWTEVEEGETTKYTVSYTAGEGTTLTLKNGDTTVTSGAKVEKDTVLTIIASAAEGYKDLTVSVNGITTTENTVKVTADTTVTTSATKISDTKPEKDPTKPGEDPEKPGKDPVKPGDSTVSDNTVSENTVSANCVEHEALDVEFADSAAEEVPFSGAKYTPEVVVKCAKCGATLALGTDYTVSYKDNTGKIDQDTKATVTVKGKGNYSFTATLEFMILQPVIEDSYDSVKGYKIDVAKSVDFTGEAVEPEIKVTNKGAEVESGKYGVIYANNVNAGTATVAIFGAKVNGKATIVKKTFKINPVAVDKLALKNEDIVGEDAKAEFTASGAVVSINQLTYEGYDLVEGKDFTYKFANNKKITTSAKPAKVTLTFKGNFKGKAEAVYQIVGTSEVQAFANTVTDGAKLGKANVFVFDADGNQLKVNKDFAIEYEDGVDANTAAKAGETYTITIKPYTGKGATGTLDENVSEVLKITGISKDDAKKNTIKKVDTKKTQKAYTGSKVELDEKEISVEIGNKATTEDYELVYAKNINKGSATVYAIGKDSVAGMKKASFKIVPRAKIK